MRLLHINASDHLANIFDLIPCSQDDQRITLCISNHHGFLRRFSSLFNSSACHTIHLGDQFAQDLFHIFYIGILERNHIHFLLYGISLLVELFDIADHFVYILFFTYQYNSIGRIILQYIYFFTRDGFGEQLPCHLHSIGIDSFGAGVSKLDDRRAFLSCSFYRVYDLFDRLECSGKRGDREHIVVFERDYLGIFMKQGFDLGTDDCCVGSFELEKHCLECLS